VVALPGAAPATRTRDGRWRTAIAALVLVVVVAGLLVRTPYLSFAPGSPVAVSDSVTIEGVRSKPSAGRFLLLTVNISPAALNLWQLLWVAVAPDVTVIPRSKWVPPDTTRERVREQNEQAIDLSKYTASVAAYRALGRTTPAISGVEILGVDPAAGASGVLFQSDVITHVERRRVRTTKALASAMRGRTPGRAVELTIRREGLEKRVRVRTHAGEDGRTLLGVRIRSGEAYRLPREVTIDSGDVIGPSGGLVFALAIADALVDEDLTRGRTVGVTGTLSLNRKGIGIVGAVGGIREKLVAAVRDGATVFLVPKTRDGSLEREARAAAPTGLDVIAVHTVREAIQALRALD